MTGFYCRVCGFKQETKPWGEDGNTPVFEICSCCGAEFGNDDYSLESVKNYRAKWIKEGAKWFHPKVKPDDWKVDQQMKHVPIRWR